MATGATAGYKGYLYAGTTGAPVKIAEIREWTISGEMGEIDATSRDSSGHREVIVGTRGWTASANYLYAGDNASQKALYSALNNGTLQSIEFYPVGTSSQFPIYTGYGYVTSWSPSSPHDDAIAVDVDFVGTGVLTQSTS